jgi:hypothetical protein
MLYFCAQATLDAAQRLDTEEFLAYEEAMPGGRMSKDEAAQCVPDACHALSLSNVIAYLLKGCADVFQGRGCTVRT